MSRYTCLRIVASLVAVVAAAPASAQLRMQVLPFESVTLTTLQVLLGEPQGTPVTLAGELRLPLRLFHGVADDSQKARAGEW
jgi:hypothetical protein